MDLSGIIFVVLAVAWAGYLIPKALRHQGDAARTRSVDRSSAAARVLAHREAEGRDSRPVAGGRARSESPRVRSPRPASAARRRRRLLAVLVLGLVGTGMAGYLGYAPWWTLAVPGALTIGFLVLCLATGRRRRASARSVRVRPASASAAVQAPVQVQVPAQAPVPVQDEPVPTPAFFDGQAEDQPPREPLPVRVEDVDVALADPEPQVAAAVGGTLWDPLPITLPTYVTKPAARRTVRTIELGEPGTWTSGRTAEDAEIAARAADARVPQQRSEEAGQRAVSS